MHTFALPVPRRALLLVHNLQVLNRRTTGSGLCTLGWSQEKKGASQSWADWETIPALKSPTLLGKSVLCSSRGKAEILPLK